jgi:hypothetical protein
VGYGLVLPIHTYIHKGTGHVVIRGLHVSSLEENKPVINKIRYFDVNSIIEKFIHSVF